MPRENQSSPTLHVYSPEGQVADQTRLTTPAKLVRSSAPLRIAVLDNGKAGADILLTRMAERLAAESGGTFVGVHQKQTAATPCEPELIDLLAREADVVLTGTAD